MSLASSTQQASLCVQCVCKQEFEESGKEHAQQQRGLEDKKPYRFNKRESQIMRIAVDTMHMAGMALVCQGFAIFLMGASLPTAVQPRHAYCQPPDRAALDCI